MVKATIMATRPMLEPTDRSMPWVRMTIVCASATITRMEISNRMSLKFPGVRKTGARRLTKMARIRIITMIPNSRKRVRVQRKFERAAVGFLTVKLHFLLGWSVWLQR